MNFKFKYNGVQTGQKNNKKKFNFGWKNQMKILRLSKNVNNNYKIQKKKMNFQFNKSKN